EGISPRPPRAYRDPLDVVSRTRGAAARAPRRTGRSDEPSPRERERRVAGRRAVRQMREMDMATDGSEAGTPRTEVDLGRLPEIPGGDTEFEQQIAGEYVNQAADLLQEMAEAAGRHDAEAVRRSAHTLKGSSRTIGALSVAGVAAEIEQLAAAGDPSAAATRLDRARACLAATRQRLDRYFGSDAYRRAA